MKHLSRTLLTLLFVILTPSILDAQRNCVKGKPCGRSCIARDKVCRIGTPTTTTPRAPAAAAPSVSHP